MEALRIAKLEEALNIDRRGVLGFLGGLVVHPVWLLLRSLPELGHALARPAALTHFICKM